MINFPYYKLQNLIRKSFCCIVTAALLLASLVCMHACMHACIHVCEAKEGIH